MPVSWLRQSQRRRENQWRVSLLFFEVLSLPCAHFLVICENTKVFEKFWLPHYWTCLLRRESPPSKFDRKLLTKCVWWCHGWPAGFPDVHTINLHLALTSTAADAAEAQRCSPFGSLQSLPFHLNQVSWKLILLKKKRLRKVACNVCLHYWCWPFQDQNLLPVYSNVHWFHCWKAGMLSQSGLDRTWIWIRSCHNRPIANKWPPVRYGRQLLNWVILCLLF